MKKNSVTDKLNDALGVARELLDDDDIIDGELVPYDDTPQTEPKRPMALRQPMYDDDLANDYRDTRDTLKALMTKAEIALDGLLTLASESEHPRTYEVAGQLIKTISDVSKDLIGLQKTMREMKSKDEPKGGGNMVVENAENVTNQTIVFTGTTKELQDMLKQAKLDLGR